MALRALIIANGTFAHAEIPALKSPVSDAQRLKALLSRPDVGPFEVEICADFDSYALRQVVERFFNDSGLNDRQLMFFSGHGFKHGLDSRLYFGTKDTRRDSMKSSSLSARFVFEEASASNAQQTIIFIDSCYSGAFVKGQTLKTSDHVMARDDFAVDGAHGMAIITASSSVQTAAEVVVDDYSQSIFTRHLINGIETGKADVGNNGRITIDGLFCYIRDQMRKDAPGQEPKPHYFGLGGTVEVMRNPVKPPVALPPRLLKKIGGRTYEGRRIACFELYHHADTHPVAVDLVREALDRLSRDPHDYVKDEARHQLARLNERFPPPETKSDPAPVDEVDAAAPVKPEIAQIAQPEPYKRPPEPKRDDAPATIVNAPATPVTAVQTGSIVPPKAAPSDQAPSVSRTGSKPPNGSSKPLLRRLQLLFAAASARLGMIVGGLGAAGAAATVIVLGITSPKPGEWLIGQWVIDQSENGCARRLHISQGKTNNELVFENPDGLKKNGDADQFKVESDAVLTTSAWRYRLGAAGIVTMQQIDGEGTTMELSKCAN